MNRDRDAAIRDLDSAVKNISMLGASDQTLSKVSKEIDSII